MLKNFRWYLMWDEDVFGYVGTRIHRNHMPDSSSYPAVWFSIGSETQTRSFDGSAGLKTSTIDLEVLSLDMGQAIDIAAAIRTRIDNFAGDMAGHTVQAVFVSDKDEDYLPRNDATDDGITEVSLNIEVYHL